MTPYQASLVLLPGITLLYHLPVIAGSALWKFLHCDGHIEEISRMGFQGLFQAVFFPLRG